MVAESVRLVVWDLDDTFWKGTVTEGGIQEYVQAHHDIVIELARRGILSSICSKNDKATILAILKEKGIQDYFVFPSISWEPKGMRLAQLVETVQLRAPTIMFIDDNPNNRAEAAAVVPGLQVEDETFIPRMLADPRFKGKDDGQLTRLAQYKLLEERKRDEEQAVGGNEDFLRSCDVRVYIEYDVEAHIDRAIELINRTNQLNYTKKRLPEDNELAREELRNQLRPFSRVAGLVQVIDKYGNYGFVGFFMLQTSRKKIELGAANTHFIHYCFSCRTLGMLVEQWVYMHLNRPEIDVIGDVLTKLSDKRIDWIREVQAIDDADLQYPKVAPQIVLFGGCEANAIGVYLQPYTEKMNIYGNYVSNGIMNRLNYASRMLDIADRNPEQIANELEILGLPKDLETGDMFGEAVPGTLFVINLGIDADGGDRLCHKEFGWTFALEPRSGDWRQIFSAPDEELAKTLDLGHFSASEVDHIKKVSRHVRQNYTIWRRPDDLGITGDTRQVIERIPLGSKLIILLEQDLRRDGKDKTHVYSSAMVFRYREMIERLSEEYAYVSTIAIADCLESPDEILEANHFHRAVYFRIAQKIIDIGKKLAPRATRPASNAEIKQRITSEVEVKRSEVEANRPTRDAEEFVVAVYQALLRRDPEPGIIERVAKSLIAKDTTPAHYIRAIAQCNEFRMKWQPAPRVEA